MTKHVVSNEQCVHMWAQRPANSLHLQTLVDKGACSDRVELFRERFGESVRVTEALCVKVGIAVSEKCDVDHIQPALRLVR
jgi:hypothetical protein